MMIADKHAAATIRKAIESFDAIERATNRERATTPNATNGARTTPGSKKKRCKTKSADGAVVRFRSLIQTKKVW